jgi:aconitate decarboxylase
VSRLDEIVRIDIYLPEAAYGHGGWQPKRPLAPIGAQMNVMYTVAVALLDGSALIDQFAEDCINRDDVWTLIGRTCTHQEKAYDAPPVEDRLTTRVVVTLKNSNTREKTVVHPTGTGDGLLNPRRDCQEVPRPDPLCHRSG